MKKCPECKQALGSIALVRLCKNRHARLKKWVKDHKPRLMSDGCFSNCATPTGDHAGTFHSEECRSARSPK